MDNLQKLTAMVETGSLRHLKMFWILSDDMYYLEKKRGVSLAPVKINKESN